MPVAALSPCRREHLPQGRGRMAFADRGFDMAGAFGGQRGGGQGEAPFMSTLR